MNIFLVFSLSRKAHDAAWSCADGMQHDKLNCSGTGIMPYLSCKKVACYNACAAYPIRDYPTKFFLFKRSVFNANEKSEYWLNYSVS